MTSSCISCPSTTLHGARDSDSTRRSYHAHQTSETGPNIITDEESHLSESDCIPDQDSQSGPGSSLRKLWPFGSLKSMVAPNNYSNQRKGPIGISEQYSILLLAMAVAGFTVISVLAGLLIYFNIYLRRLIPHNDIEAIVASWGKPGSRNEDKAGWPTNFSAGIMPIPCHSHNDYWRHVPLYDALAAGCTGVEADVWLTDTDTDLLVGHSHGSLTAARSLRSLYIDPLVSILSHQNQATNVTRDITPSTINGVFDTSPNTSLVLLIDIKTDGAATFPKVLEQLEPLRSQGWLTYFNGSIVPGPITVVGTGNTPFDLIIANSTYRDIFFDAPLDQLWGEQAPANATLYTNQNSLYASVSMQKEIGNPWLGALSPQQVNIIRGQIRGAREHGLKARYWDTPSWPVGVRDHIWDVLEKEGVGMLSVDDLQDASKRNWGA